MAILERDTRVHPLRLARVRLGVTQRELERRLGLPATLLSHIEACRRVPDPALRARIAEELAVDVDGIFPPHVLVERPEAAS